MKLKRLQAEGGDAFSEFHLYVCLAFLVRWSDKLREMDFQVRPCPPLPLPLPFPIPSPLPSSRFPLLGKLT